jgi:hypothetical protein
MLPWKRNQWLLDRPFLSIEYRTAVKYAFQLRKVSTKSTFLFWTLARAPFYWRYPLFSYTWGNGLHKLPKFYQNRYSPCQENHAFHFRGVHIFEAGMFVYARHRPVTSSSWMPNAIKIRPAFQELMKRTSVNTDIQTDAISGATFSYSEGWIFSAPPKKVKLSLCLIN